ncbi:unnamed protein product [Rhizopus stolonifer]
MAQFKSTSIKPDIVPFHNISNYSLSSYSSFELPSSPTEPRIKDEEQDARQRQLIQQIDHLKVTNVRLKRANSILKTESDRRVKEETTGLKQALKSLVEQNIRLQRSNRLLRDDFDTLREELKNVKQIQIQKMTHIGPEYEYLVQMVNALYKQLLSNESRCLKSCCFTGSPTITNENERHTCRPIIKSHLPTELKESRLETENIQLKDTMGSLINEKEELTGLINGKDEDNKALRYQLKLKDDIVKQLESDFNQMALDMNDLQKSLYYNPSAESSLSELQSFPSVPI